MYYMPKLGHLSFWSYMVLHKICCEDLCLLKKTLLLGCTNDILTKHSKIILFIPVLCHGVNPARPQS